MTKIFSSLIEVSIAASNRDPVRLKPVLVLNQQGENLGYSLEPCLLIMFQHIISLSATAMRTRNTAVSFLHVELC